MIAMKKYLISGSILLLAILLLGACGDAKKVEGSSTPEEAETDLGFTSFELDVDTADHKEAVEASLAMEGSKIEAEYVNRIEPQKLEGDKAYDELKPILKGLELTNEMSKEEVIEKVSKAFEVEDYTKFDLVVEYSDGEEKEYKDTKSK